MRTFSNFAAREPFSIQTQSNLFNTADYKASMGATETQRKGENYNIWLVIGCGTKLQGYKATMLQSYNGTT